MSWDVQLLRPAAAGAPDAPLGPAEEVRASISAIHPAVDWSDPAWGVLEGKDWSIELNTGADPVITSIMLHVRGSGDPVSAIAALCKGTGWSAFDLATGELLDPDKPSADGWADFQGFRGQLLAAAGLGEGHGTALPLVHLRIEGTVLHRAEGRSGARAHDLGTASSVRFERAINWVSIVLGALSVTAGLGLKFLVPFPWLGWVLLALGALSGLVFVTSSRGDWLVIEEGTAKFRYPLAGTPSEVLAFQDTVETRRLAGLAREPARESTRGS